MVHQWNGRPSGEDFWCQIPARIVAEVKDAKRAKVGQFVRVQEALCTAVVPEYFLEGRCTDAEKAIHEVVWQGMIPGAAEKV